MKITTFDPMILTPRHDETVALFEALGFQKTHNPSTTTEAGEITCTRMKNPDGFHVDIADMKHIDRDITYIRMNVDDFEEAYKILTEHGFKNTRGDETLGTGSAAEATMVSPSGFRIALIKHFRK